MINLVWAMDENRLVGKDNKLPWHIKEDLQHFKNITNNETVLMGRETYLSMKTYYKKKPFPFKKTYVADLDNNEYPDAETVTDVESFLTNYKEDEDLFVIGGPTIYKLALPFADGLFITYVLKAYEGNVYFPDFDIRDYKLKYHKHSENLIYTLYTKN